MSDGSIREGTEEVNKTIISKNSGICLVILLLVIIIFAITNPTKEQFIKYAKEQIIHEFNNNFIATGLTSLAGDSVIENSTTTTNYIIFTVFKTSILKNDIYHLGVLGNFIRFGNDIKTTNLSSSKTPTPQTPRNDAPQNYSSGNSSANSSKTTSDKLFTFEGKYPDHVTSGVPFYVTFLIKNNYNVPIIASEIEIYDSSTVDRWIYPDKGWVYTKGGLIKRPKISISNLYVKPGESINSNFGIQINQPGSYQFNISPKVTAGRSIDVGTYYITVVVQAKS